MGYSKIKSSSIQHEYVEADVNEYMIDEPADISTLTEPCAPGSMAYTADMKYIYVMDRNGKWVQVV